MIIQLPPLLEYAIIHVCIVVTVLGEAIVDHDAMQVVWVLAALDVRLLKDLLHVGNLLLKFIRLLLGRDAELFEHIARDLNLLHGYAELGLAELCGIEEVNRLVVDDDGLVQLVLIGLLAAGLQVSLTSGQHVDELAAFLVLGVRSLRILFVRILQDLQVCSHLVETLVMLIGGLLVFVEE